MLEIPDLKHVMRLVRPFLLAVLLLPSTAARGQVIPVGDPLEDYARVMQLLGHGVDDGFNLRPVRVPRDVGGPWSARMKPYETADGLYDVRIVSPNAALGWMSTRPAGMNDGFVWQGRGATLRGTAGAFGRFSILSAAFRPEFALIQNRDFDAGPGSPDQYLGRPTIDAPRRFGDEPLRLTHLGQSYAELSAGPAAAGLSTANMWWGPGTRNAIVLSNNGPGFGHAYVGTSRPVDVRIAHVHGRWFWGNLIESDYFDDDPRNDRRDLSGLTLEIQPHVVPGLYLGAARVFMQAKDEDESRALFIVFQNLFKDTLEEEHDRFGFDENDQIASLFGRWIFPRSGFEVYGEYGIGDHSQDLRDFVVQFKHASGYTFGLQKASLLRNKIVRFNLEITRLEAPKSDILRVQGDAPGFYASPTAFYINEVVRQGYTHRGQIIGAGIGPGSNSQYAGADLFTEWGRAGWYAQRLVHDNDLFYSISGSPSEHQVEFISGIRGLVFLQSFELTADVALRRFLNLHYRAHNDVWNLAAGLGVRWNVGEYR